MKETVKLNEEIKSRVELVFHLQDKIKDPQTLDTRPYEIIYKVCMDQLEKIINMKEEKNELHG